MSKPYDLKAAARYWGEERLKQGDELAAVLSLREPAEVNRAYDLWETSLVVESMQGRRGRQVVDLACGVGRITVPLAGSGARVLALDNAPGMLKRCESRVRRAKVQKNVTYALGPAWNIPAADASQDGVVCVGLLEHLPPSEQLRVLREAGRVLKRGGSFATVLNNPGSVLLQSPTDNRLRKGHQFPNGYYCALVDRKKLLGALGRHFKFEAVGTNLFYSLLRHVFRTEGDLRKDSMLRRASFRLATQLDLRFRLKGAADETLTDHTFFRATRLR